MGQKVKVRFHASSPCGSQLLYSSSCISRMWNEPPRDKTNNVVVRPAKIQVSLDIDQSDQSLPYPHEESYPFSAQRRLWSDLADAQADLSLRWAHSHFYGFVTRRLKYGFFVLSVNNTVQYGFLFWQYVSRSSYCTNTAFYFTVTWYN